MMDGTTAARRVLVTGATGFLGGRLVRELLDRGVWVRALGRNLKIGLALAARGADFVPVDLRDRAGVMAACRGMTHVVHAGALSSAWGRYQDFYDINVTGTENIIAGCMASGIERLVYISSPSVMSVHAPQVRLDESHPLPGEFVSDYSKTKALAEERVEKAFASGLETVILRPKAIYGPGDQALFPRIIEAVSKGRLPVFGDGQAMTNITHVTDVVQSILLALDSAKAAGKTYLITGGEEIGLYEVIGLIAQRLGYKPPSKKMPTAKAMKIAGIMEGLWRTLPLAGEPILTRYKVSIMAHTQTYDISAAKRDLGYVPAVPWREGIGQFLEGLKKPAEPEKKATATGAEAGSCRPVRLKTTILQAGRMETMERLFGMSRRWSKIVVPALFALLEHPTHGPGLFDTGYSTRFFEVTEKFPARIYQYLTPVKIGADENAGARVAASGVDPESVEWIVISHFDPDHIGGLKDFPRARFFCSWRAWQAVAGKTGWAAMNERFLPDLLPDDFCARLVALPDPEGPGIGPFEASLDLFGDGSLLLVDLSGHQAGQLGAFITNTEGQNLLLCADGCWTTQALGKGGGGTGMHRVIARDRRLQDETYRKLNQVLDGMKDVHLLPSHCPLAAGKFVLPD